MGEICIRRGHALTPQDARNLADSMALRLTARFDLACRWEAEDVMRFERDGVEGVLHLRPGEILIQARLGFLLSLAQGQIEQAIADQLYRLLQPGIPEADSGAQPDSA